MANRLTQFKGQLVEKTRTAATIFVEEVRDNSGEWVEVGDEFDFEFSDLNKASQASVQALWDANDTDSTSVFKTSCDTLDDYLE